MSAGGSVIEIVGERRVGAAGAPERQGQDAGGSVIEIVGERRVGAAGAPEHQGQDAGGSVIEIVGERRVGAAGLLERRKTTARELVPIIGLTHETIARRLKAMNDDRQAVIRYYQTHGIRPRQRKPIAYNGRFYPSRRALAVELAATIGAGHGADAIKVKLNALADDIAAVVE
jgi:hypothetical protein